MDAMQDVLNNPQWTNLQGKVMHACVRGWVGGWVSGVMHVCEAVCVYGCVSGVDVGKGEGEGGVEVVMSSRCTWLCED